MTVRNCKNSNDYAIDGENLPWRKTLRKIREMTMEDNFHDAQLERGCSRWPQACTDRWEGSIEQAESDGPSDEEENETHSP